MNLLRRFVTFNLVGVLGMAVQLAALFCFNHLFAGRYLLATAAALELTLLHNFLWHRRTTWRDRTGGEPGWRQMVRFHLGNGMVSLVGNLLLMRVLVQAAHLPVLVSNALAIACCSLVNFAVSHRWTFRGASKRVKQEAVPGFGILSVLLLMVLPGAGAQTETDSAKRVPVPGVYRGRCVPNENGEDCAYANVFFGPALTAGRGFRASGTAGVTFGQYFTQATGTGLRASPQFELGLVGPLPGGHPVDGLVSVGWMFSGKLPRQPRFLFLAAGYTRLFVTGDAVNFGFGVDLGRPGSGLLRRLELRDYWLFTGPGQHVLSLRLALGGLIDD